MLAWKEKQGRGQASTASAVPAGQTSAAPAVSKASNPPSAKGKAPPPGRPRGLGEVVESSDVLPPGWYRDDSGDIHTPLRVLPPAPPDINNVRQSRHRVLGDSGSCIYSPKNHETTGSVLQSQGFFGDVMFWQQAGANAADFIVALRELRA